MNADFQTGKQKRQTKYDPQIELKKRKRKEKHTHARTVMRIMSYRNGNQEEKKKNA
jgi:hypothetical protein